MPRFDLLDPEKYNLITVQTSRGCPHRCEFCASSALLSRHYKVKPVAKIMDEIRAIKRIWPHPFIEFADDNTFVNRRHSKELLRALAPEHMGSYSRPAVRWIDVGEDEAGQRIDNYLIARLKGVPKFKQAYSYAAFNEGWALYAETLGYPMGLYKDPMQHWGTLDDEMLRAMRLVVDTGLHTKGWSREQAIDYMLANSGMGRTDATAEVERYIAIPGQALAYKIGALTIQRLRHKAEAAMGPRFDIRAFHEQVLGSGALPLPVLEAKIDRWIAAAR
mgnify:CR=1 FL=1